MKIAIKNKRVYGEARVEAEKEPSMITAMPKDELLIKNEDVIEMVGQVPYQLAGAYVDSVTNAKYAMDAQEKLNDMADNAFTPAKEIKEMDKEAVGKERDYDYTHPIVDNIYTGKLLLDE